MFAVNLLIGRLPGAALTGAGCGLAYLALGSAALARAAAQSYAAGSAINAMFRQLGAALGFALIASVVGTATVLGAPTAFGNGRELAGLAGAAAVIPALGLCRTKPDPAEIAEAAGGDASPAWRTRSDGAERWFPRGSAKPRYQPAGCRSAGSTRAVEPEAWNGATKR